MPTSTLEYTREAQDKALNTLRQSQEAVVKAVGGWAKAVEGSVPETPAIPAAKGVPTLEELVQSSFDFAGEVLSAQRSFTEELITAAAPAIKTAPVGEAAKPAAKTTTAKS
jgi:hypothetical protein